MFAWVLQETSKKRKGKRKYPKKCWQAKNNIPKSLLACMTVCVLWWVEKGVETEQFTTEEHKPTNDGNDGTQADWLRLHVCQKDTADRPNVDGWTGLKEIRRLKLPDKKTDEKMKRRWKGKGPRFPTQKRKHGQQTRAKATLLHFTSLLQWLCDSLRN